MQAFLRLTIRMRELGPSFFNQGGCHIFLIFQNAGEKGSSFRSKFLCGGGRKKRPPLPEFPREPEPNKTLDVTNIV